MSDSNWTSFWKIHGTPNDSSRSFRTYHDSLRWYFRVLPCQSRRVEHNGDYRFAHAVLSGYYPNSIFQSSIFINYFLVPVLSSFKSIAVIRYFVLNIAVILPNFGYFTTFLLLMNCPPAPRCHTASFLLIRCQPRVLKCSGMCSFVSTLSSPFAQLYKCSTWLTLLSLPIWRTMRSTAYSRRKPASSSTVVCPSTLSSLTHRFSMRLLDNFYFCCSEMFTDDTSVDW